MLSFPQWWLYYSHSSYIHSLIIFSCSIYWFTSTFSSLLHLVFIFIETLLFSFIEISGRIFHFDGCFPIPNCRNFNFFSFVPSPGIQCFELNYLFNGFFSSLPFSILYVGWAKRGPCEESFPFCIQAPTGCCKRKLARSLGIGKVDVGYHCL